MARDLAPVRRRYEFDQRVGVYLPPPVKFHVPHAFAGTFQKVGPVVERRTVEEADIHVSTEGGDVGKRGIFHAGSRMTVVQEFANVRSAAAHAFEPRLRHRSQLVVGRNKPCVDAGVSLNGAGEP